MKKKFAFLFCATAIFGTTFTPISSIVNADEVTTAYTQSSNETTLFVGKESALEQLSAYYQINSEGQVTLDVSKPDLRTKLGFTTAELNYLSDLISGAEEQDSQKQIRGNVGFYLKFGPQIRGMGATGAAAFAAGYLTFYFSQLAASGPWGAGAVAALDAMIAYTVYNAINNNLKSANLIINIPGISWTKTVSIP